MRILFFFLLLLLSGCMGVQTTVGTSQQKKEVERYLKLYLDAGHKDPGNCEVRVFRQAGSPALLPPVSIDGRVYPFWPICGATWGDGTIDICDPQYAPHEFNHWAHQENDSGNHSEPWWQGPKGTSNLLYPSRVP